MREEQRHSLDTEMNPLLDFFEGSPLLKKILYSFSCTLSILLQQRMNNFPSVHSFCLCPLSVLFYDCIFTQSSVYSLADKIHSTPHLLLSTLCPLSLPLETESKVTRRRLRTQTDTDVVNGFNSLFQWTKTVYSL